MTLTNIKNMELAELRAFVVGLGAPAFRGTQVFQWLWRSRARSFEEMENLPKDLRVKLAAAAALPGLVLAEDKAALDGTHKMLVALPDGEKVESVLIPDGERRTLCISTQVGCAMGCTFCRTATMGLKRHLEGWEIAEQVILAERLCTELGDERAIHAGRSGRSKIERRLTNLVFMGMGEPLHNFDGTLRAIHLLTSPEGLDIPGRRITVSTVGLLDEARRILAETKVRLAFSLNAPDEETRSALMPINKRHSLADIVALVAALPQAQRERVTFEYVVLRGVTDRPGDEDLLARLLKPLGRFFRVNLIPFNPFEGSGFDKPLAARVEELRVRLRAGGVDAFVRRPRGDDILAACGQLAHLRESSAV